MITFVFSNQAMITLKFVVSHQVILRSNAPNNICILIPG